MHVHPPKSTRNKFFFRRSNDAPPSNESLANGKHNKPLDDTPQSPHDKPVDKPTKAKPISKPTIKTRRGYGRKNGKRKIEGKETYFSLLGTNAAGLNPKRESFFNLINNFKPSVTTVQETKFSKQGLFKIPGYQIFENVRKNKKGGGLLTAAIDDTNPVLIHSGSDDNEILTIQVEVNENKIRVINAYGPQEDDNTNKIISFWQEIESEIIDAKANNCMILIQLDANAKVGTKHIKKDPNQMSDNGRIMMDIIERQDLELANTNEKCFGTITRERVFEDKIEKSVIDFMIICEKMKGFLIEMIIDEKRKYVLKRYIKQKTKTKIITSDHNIMIGRFSIRVERKQKTARNEFFKFKCEESKQLFKEETSVNDHLSSCFNVAEEFKTNAGKFYKALQRKFHKCFKKVRIKSGTRKVGNPSMQAKLMMILNLRKQIDNCTCEMEQKQFEESLKQVEEALAKETAEANTEKIKDYIKSVETLEGRFSQINCWKLKQRLWPQSCDPPMAKRDEHGNLVTASETIKQLYIKTYKERLQHRLMKPQLMDIYFLKNELWMSRLRNMENIKTKPWDDKKLEIVLNSLKNNKAIDPNGIIHEVFKDGYCGTDLKKALLYLFNGIQKEQLIPDFMTLANITSIYKSKGSRADLANDRGIFILTTLKKILEKLVYNDNYKALDENMSDSNVGARRKRNVKDHLLIVHGVINSVIRGEDECIDIQIYDIEKAFDAMWLEDCLNDIVDTLPQHNHNDKISLLYKCNKENKVAVKTSAGLTDRVDVPCVVQQGGTWGSMMCSNSIDTIGRKCIQRGEHLYKYKKTASILPLAFVDDLSGISKCGKESSALNNFLTTQIELKKLRFHVPDEYGKTKCHKLHIGKKNIGCPLLKVHGTIMPEVTEDVYLGDILSSNGKNTKNIKSRISKGLGIINQIFNMLDNISFGPHYFEMALLFRDSMLINGTLNNAEIWYNFGKNEIEEFECLDRLFLRKLLAVPKSTPHEALYLELGILPINTIIKARRLNYLHDLLKKDKKGMVYSFFITQWYKPCKGDWTEQVKKDLTDFRIPPTLEYVEGKSKYYFKNLVKQRAKQFTLEILLEKKEKHSKMVNLNYAELKIQEYFLKEDLDNNQKKTIFKLRTRMENFGENFRCGKAHVICPLCGLHRDSQDLCLICPIIRQEIRSDGNISEIYGNEIQNDIIHTVIKVLEKRREIINQKP